MNLLWDTHTVIWFFEGDAINLGRNAKLQIENPVNANFISIITFWEIAIKLSMGKLDMKIAMADLYALVWENGIEILPIQFEHTLTVSNLAFLHKDPFDRMLIAQASCENMHIVGKDEYFKQYDVQMIW